MLTYEHGGQFVQSFQVEGAPDPVAKVAQMGKKDRTVDSVVTVHSQSGRPAGMETRANFLRGQNTHIIR